MNSDLNMINKQSNHHVVKNTSIHIGFFDDIPAQYLTCHYQGSRCDRLVFLNKDLKNRKGSDLLNKIKASRLVQKNSPITFKQSKDGQLCIDFNFKECE